MFTHSYKSIGMSALLAVALLIGACAPAPTVQPAEPAAIEPPAEPAATEPPATEPPATEPPDLPVGAEKSFVEPAPVLVHEYDLGGQPRLCDPANPVLTPVGQLEIQRTDSTILDGGTAVFVDYVNDNGQTFRISVHSSDPAVAREYLTTLAVCLEAIEVGPPSGIEAASPPFDQFLQDAISDATGLSLEELQARRDEYIAASEAAGETPSLRGFLEFVGADPDAVLQDAVARAGQAIDDARNAGFLTTDEQADNMRARSQIQYEEEFADGTFSILAEEILAFSGNFADELKANPANIVIEPEWLDTSEQENYMIFSIWEPTIYGPASHWYIWKQNKYVDARLYVYKGKAGPYLYRWEGYCRYLTSTSKIGPGWTTWIEGSSSSYMWYRLRVYGWYSYNTYYLDGTWRGTSPDGSTSCGHP